MTKTREYKLPKSLWVIRQSDGTLYVDKLSLVPFVDNGMYVSADGTTFQVLQVSNEGEITLKSSDHIIKDSTLFSLLQGALDSRRFPSELDIPTRDKMLFRSRWEALLGLSKQIKAAIHDAQEWLKTVEEELKNEVK